MGVVPDNYIVLLDRTDSNNYAAQNVDTSEHSSFLICTSIQVIAQCITSWDL